MVRLEVSIPLGHKEIGTSSRCRRFFARDGTRVLFLHLLVWSVYCLCPGSTGTYISHSDPKTIQHILLFYFFNRRNENSNLQEMESIRGDVEAEIAAQTIWSEVQNYSPSTFHTLEANICKSYNHLGNNQVFENEDSEC